ncbi:MAG: MgtC/SapB family protein [Acidobacteriota bacterium]
MTMPAWWWNDAVQHVGKLVLATLLGGAIGLNRELHQKPAGFRTHAMVALGAALMTMVAVDLGARRGLNDVDAVSRVLQGIIAGIGFVGGGAILRRDSDPNVHGLTTAASIWVVAAMGSAAGLGLWLSAIVSVALALAVLTVGSRIDRAVHRIQSGRERTGP